ncbi:hypothetical protein [Kitasatospora purpeofusca]|uniref:hypothetical protein n=1 Tax=Kitasatospora purpeofusca TaxID=67352 RepID=UPI003866EEC4
MSETSADLGFVTASSGVLMLGMADWIDHWSELDDPLSARAMAAAEHGGGHLVNPSTGSPTSPTGGSTRTTPTPARKACLVHSREFDGTRLDLRGSTPLVPGARHLLGVRSAPCSIAKREPGVPVLQERDKSPADVGYEDHRLVRTGSVLE